MSRIPICLSLRKPKNWDVALTTSSSSAGIAIPDIRLHDESGRIIIDTSAGTIRLDVLATCYLRMCHLENSS